MLEIKIQGSVDEIKSQLLDLSQSFGLTTVVSEEVSEEVREEVKVEDKPKKAKKTAAKTVESDEKESVSSTTTLDYEKDIKPLIVKLSRKNKDSVVALLEEFGVSRFSAVEDEQMSVLQQRLNELLDND